MSAATSATLSPMLARVDSFVLQGIDAVLCELEVDLSPVGLPKQTIVGLPDAAVRESIERVRTAVLNCGYRFPQTRMTINLAPADIRKEGPVYDVPIALAILAAEGSIQPAGASNGNAGQLRDYLIAGELALDGRIRPVNGVISLALLARQLGKRGVIVPDANAHEAAAVDTISVIGVETLGQIVGYFNGTVDVPAVEHVDAEYS
ncbi:MAG: magnesium chelatase domain-containing protein, partial [Phycisphaerales bacterium]